VLPVHVFVANNTRPLVSRWRELVEQAAQATAETSLTQRHQTKSKASCGSGSEQRSMAADFQLGQGPLRPPPVGRPPVGGLSSRARTGACLPTCGEAPADGIPDLPQIKQPVPRCRQTGPARFPRAEKARARAAGLKAAACFSARRCRAHQGAGGPCESWLGSGPSA